MNFKLLFTIVFLGVFSNSFCQKNQEVFNKKLNHLKDELALTDSQAKELQSIHETLREENETSSHVDKKAAYHKAISDVLTEEQLTKFNELKTKRKKTFAKESGKQFKKRKRKFAKGEETQKRLSEMRMQLDESISSEDKKRIDELRQNFTDRKESFKAKKGTYQEMSKEDKQELKQQRLASRELMKADFEEAGKLVEKYESEISLLFEANKSFFDDRKALKKEELKEKRNKKGEGEDKQDYLSQKKEVKRKSGKRKRGQHHKKGGKKFSKEVRFLLMNPDQLNDRSQDMLQKPTSLSIAPNPTSQMTNISYEVKERGNVRVELRDELGRVYEVLEDKFLEIGTYTKTIDASNYQDKIYFISIQNGKSIETKKLLIQR